MKCVTIICLLIIFSFRAQTQNIIEGKIFDSVENTSIPFVNVISKDDAKGTASNIDGSFIISVSKFPSTFVFSHVNYGKTEIIFTSTNNNKEIFLKPLSFQLDDIVISAFDPTGIVSSTFENLSSSSSSIVAKGFYRQWTKNDDLYSEILESFFTSKIDSRGIKAAQVSQGRYAIKDNKDKGLMTYKNFSVFTNTFPLVQLEERSFLYPIRKNAENFFNFKLIKVINGNDSNKINVIAFEPKPTNNLPAFKGELFIDDSYNLIRFKGVIEDDRFRPLGAIDPTRVSKLRLEVDAFCDNKVKNTQILENMKVDLNYKYRYDDKNSRDIHTSSFYFVYEVNPPDSNIDLPNNNQLNDYSAINNSVYDESFWEKLHVLAQTPIEKEVFKQFKRSKLFTRIFQK